MINSQLKIIFIVARIIVAILIALAFLKLPYGYYTLLKFITSIVLVFGLILYLSSKKIYWVAIFGLFALIYNPVFPLHLGRDIWEIINILTIAVIIISFFIKIENFNDKEI
ncbi:MAG: hypothetical protein HW421_233 [Ignavibacteria bacterium]|nr:hypothetical protein [Ignavibacteria bacterium]